MSQEVIGLQQILRTLTAEQLRFVSERVNCKFDYEAAEAIGISRETASRWSNKSDVDEAVKLMMLDGVEVAREILRRSTSKAAQEIAKQLENRSVNVRYKAAKDILDRNIGNAPAKHEVSGQVGVTVDDWRKNREARRKQADDTLDLFDE